MSTQQEGSHLQPWDWGQPLPLPLPVSLPKSLQMGREEEERGGDLPPPGASGKALPA